MKISTRDGLENTTRPFTTWPVARRRLRSGEVIPVMQPSFSLSVNDTIFTMGSCFARNIEAHLARIGCSVPTLHFSTPASERKGPTANHVLTLFTPPTFLQEIAWIESIHMRDGLVSEDDCAPLGFELPNGEVIDLALAGATPVAKERFVARRQEIYDLYRNVFTADCLVMTPGLVEAWFDRKFARYTNSAPFIERNPLDPDRYELHVLTYEDCVRNLSQTIDIVRKHNPKIKVLITTSPVPLRVTFTNQDIIVANTYSKSVLRAACDSLAGTYPHLDYFPSYEAVMLSTRNVWEKDRRHVTDYFVGRIVDSLSASYFPELGRKITLQGEHSLMQRIARFFGRR